MRVMADPFRFFLASELCKLLPKLSSDNAANALHLTHFYEALVEPPNPEMGDLAFGCFQLAKLLKKNPAQVAKDVQGLFPESKSSLSLQKIEAVGPYVNFAFAPAALGEYFLQPVISGKYFSQKLTENSPRTLIEFSQPNTHKELHVGHMRNLCLGDAIVRMLRYSGYDVASTTFPGDVGTHVAKCLWYMKFRNKETVPARGRGEWLGQMYSRGNNLLEDEEKTPAGPENKKILTEILHQLEQKKGEYFELWQETRQWSIELMERAYLWADVKFDSWVWESDVDSPSVKFVKKLLADGKLEVSQGAVGLNLEAEKLGFCLLLKQDGTGLYATKDLELARQRFEGAKFEKIIYVVDVRQALHFNQVFKVLEKIGYPQAENCFHLQYNFVELPDGAMSSRKGNIIPLMELVQKMADSVKTQYLERYRGEWQQTEIDLVAEQVAKGAIKFGMLKMDTNKKIVFDMSEWLKIEGESGPFVQYSAARILSLCRKQGYKSGSVDFSKLTHPAEVKLIRHLMNFNTVVVKSGEDFRPGVLCTFLVEAAKKFNFFYHECSIGQAENEALKQARLALSFATGEVLKHGLGLLGIPCPERM